jgi:hypothetical protein
MQGFLLFKDVARLTSKGNLKKKEKLIIVIHMYIFPRHFI